MTTDAKTYFEMAKERAQELEMDALADGHAALALQAQRLASRGPQYPAQPANSPWGADPVPPEPPLGIDISAVPDVSRVDQ
jgi:hypothetical protein